MGNISDMQILLVEGKRGNHASFSTDLVQKGCNIHHAQNGKLAAAQLSNDNYDLVILDAASLGTKGTRITGDLLKVDPTLPIILITADKAQLNGNMEAKFVLQLPFTVQKLLNRIKNFSPREPKDIVHAGPIHFCRTTNYLRCNGHEARLTPRLAELLMILIEHQGHILDRETLFKQVWSTEYLGDTRSLDVHISWLRKIIEEDPRQPKLLVTIRSVGYKLNN